MIGDEKMKLNADDIFGVMNYIRIASDTDKFRAWLSREQKIKDDAKIFDGYRFFLESAIRSFMNVLIYDSSLDLKEDFAFFRARFSGAKLSKIPNTCEKTVLIKNINEKMRAIKRTRSWDGIKEALEVFDNHVIKVFENIYKDDVTVAPEIKISKEKALSYATMFYLCIYMNDTQRYMPHGHYVSILDNRITPEQHGKNFQGYKLALKFVWFCLLGDRFYSTSLVDMHKPDEWSRRDEIFDMFKNNEAVKPVPESLDDYFGKIRKEVLEPLENRYGKKPVFDNIFYLKKKVSKTGMGQLLKTLKQPQLSEKDRIDNMLLWYHVDFIDPSESHIFNGVPAFISLMIGKAEMKRILGGGEKADVCKFIHPRKRENGNDFTYGILIESFGSLGLGDYSGWILFFDCCGDYSNFSGSEHAQAEMVIDKYKEMGLIEVREMTLDKDKLKQYIAHRIVGKKSRSVTSQLNEVSNIRIERDVIEKARSLMLELLSYYMLSKRKDYNIVEWNTKYNKKQIDVVIGSDSEIVVIECKYNPNNLDLDEEIKKIKNKMRSIEIDKPKRCEFWFWCQPSQKTKNKIGQSGITIKVVSEEIKNDPAFRHKEMNTIRQVMNPIKYIEHYSNENDIFDL